MEFGWSTKREFTSCFNGMILGALVNILPSPLRSWVGDYESLKQNRIIKTFFLQHSSLVAYNYRFDDIIPLQVYFFRGHSKCLFTKPILLQLMPLDRVPSLRANQINNGLPTT